MKQYLWAGIAVLFVSAHASENPFDLKENFGKLDQDQEVLLSDLKKLSELKELAEEKAMEEESLAEEALAEAKEEVATPTSVQQMVESLTEVVEEETVPSIGTEAQAVEAKEEIPMTTSVQKMVESLTEVSEEETIESQTIPADNTLDVQKNKEVDAKKENEALLEVVKKKEAELAEAKKEELRLLEMKQEEERLEVEAYEKLRVERAAEKKILEAAEKNRAMEVKAAAKVAKEKEAAKVEAEKINMTLSKVSPEETQSSVHDINVTREKIDAKIASDKAYEEAVKEMSQED